MPCPFYQHNVPLKEFFKLLEHLQASPLYVSAQSIMWNRNLPHFSPIHTGIFLPLLLYEYKDQSPAQCTILYNFFSFTNWIFNKFQVRDTQIYQLLTEKDHIEVTKIKSWLQSRGLFLQSSININFLGPKSKFSNCNLLVLKS